MLIRELRTRLPNAQFFGLGGQAMEAAGCERVARAEDIAVMGITEVIQHMPRIYGEYRRLVQSIRARRPDVAVLIDFPDVNLRLARELKKLSIPVVYFVSPQLWAWKKRRIRWVQDRVTRMLVIFPFEETYYRERGVDAEFVGHPLAELPQPTVTREEFAAQFALDPSKEWIGLLPGSRPKEVRLNLPGLAAAAAKLGNRYEYLLPAAATLPLAWVRNTVAQCGSVPIQVVEDARATLFHARASVVASGTATVEAALIGNPFIVVYRLSKLSYAVARQLINLPHIAMVNLIAGQRIVPELIQDEFTATNVVGALQPLLEEGPLRKQMRQDLLELRGALSIQEGSGSIEMVHPKAANTIARVADCVLHLAGAQNAQESFAISPE